MSNELKLKKCTICGRTSEVEENENMMCCGKEMEDIIPNTVECAVEKHIPTYDKVEDEIFVKVNHVMEKEHFIEWIALVTDNKEEMITLYPEQNAEVRFKYIPNSTLYAYCNKHGLWKKEVE